MWTSNAGAATIEDFKSNVNVLPFGMCMSPSKPQVVAGTTAAMDVLTPLLCVPHHDCRTQRPPRTRPRESRRSATSVRAA